MANGRQASAKRLKMAEQAEQQMKVHFPNYHPAWIWTRKTNDGFFTVPRTLPIVMQIIDAQTKGLPAGHTLFSLGARSPDHPVVTIENPPTFAAEAGFIGERAVDTWRKRMRQLRDLCFIQTKPGASGEFHYVLLINPNAAVELMRNQNKVQDLLYSRFLDRLMEVGAYGDIEAVHDFWKVQQAQQAAAVPVPPPPAEEAAT